MKAQTKGQGDIIDLTNDLNKTLQKNEFSEGQLTVFVVGSTASISTIEFESGLVTDMKEAYEKIASRHHDYKHHETWGCDNGSSHVRATLQGPSLTIPFVNGKMTLGTWQQVVLLEFDTKARERKVIVQMMGE